jgi:hypothetical protein
MLPNPTWLALKAIFRNTAVRITTVTLLITLALIYGLCSYLAYTIPLELRAQHLREVMKMYELAVVFGFVILLIGVTCFRVLLTFPHPLSDYGKWLQQTGWTNDRPLPWGPPTATWADGLILALIVAVANGFAWPFPVSLILVSVACLCFAATVAFLVYPFRNAWLTPCVVFSIPPIMAFAAWNRWEFGLPLCAFLVLAANAAVIRTLRVSEDWETLLAQDELYTFTFYLFTRPQQIPPDLFNPSLGWPLDSLSPKLQFFELSSMTKWLISAWVPWAMYWGVAWSREPWKEMDIAMFAVGAVASFYAVMTRVQCFSRGRPLRMSEIVVGRWLDWQFDFIWVSALFLTLLISVGAFLAQYPDLQPWGILWGFVVTAGTLFLSPAQERWYLTGCLKLFQVKVQKGMRNANIKPM